MNILIVCPTYPPEVGAAPTRLSNMAEGLTRKGHAVEVICGLPNYPKGRIFPGYRGRLSRHEEWNGVKLHRYWLYATNSTGAIAKIANMFSLALMIWAFAFRIRHILNIDLVILQTPPLPLATSGMMMFKKLYRRKTILNVSDIWPQTAVELGAMREGSLSYKVMAWMERFLYRNADMHQGQSREIMEEINSFGYTERPQFLYRNLQVNLKLNSEAPRKERERFKIVYAGLLGIAQDLLGIVENVDFRKLGVELHIYGSGKQAEAIEAIARENSHVYYHGSLPKEEMAVELKKYDASIVPLVQRITGAVPSKIFDLMALGVPILFCGGGEGARLVAGKKVGYVSEPSDYKALQENIRLLRDLDKKEYEAIRRRELDLASTEFSFSRQLDAYGKFLNSVRQPEFMMAGG